MTKDTYFSQKWRVSYAEKSIDQLKKLDKPIRQQIYDFFSQKVSESPNPRVFGKQLKGKMKNLWSYRIGDYRALVKIIDEEIVVLVVHVGHRKEVYKHHR